MLVPPLPAWQKIRTLATLAPLAILAACATQEPGTVPASAPAKPTVVTQAPKPVADNPQQAQLRELIAQQDRLYRVAAPLLTSNAQLCRGNARNLLGFTAKNKYSFPIEYAETARSLGYDDRLQVTGVLPGSGAEQAGIQRGDFLMSVAGKPMRLLLQAVGERVRHQFDSPWGARPRISKLVLIGEHGDINEAAIRAGLGLSGLNI